jgi:cbb3-type cytochrome oxidase subunit 3|tara:strand:+ start:8644 stop:8814 length:171 start_codon:yes stop_codon:yes gene_type:complete
MEDIGIFTLGYRVFATFMTEFFLIMLTGFIIGYKANSMLRQWNKGKEEARRNGVIG